MHAIHARTDATSPAPAPTTGPFPWEEPHAAPEDRAVGLELELIELVRRRGDIPDATAPEAEVLDREIEDTLAQLGEVTPALPLAG